MTVEFLDFLKLDLRVGTITQVEDFPGLKIPAYKIWVDFGIQLGIKKTSAQITQNYTKQELIGKQIIGVINIPPKQVKNFLSEFLLTGLPSPSGIVIIHPERQVTNGEKLF